MNRLISQAFKDTAHSSTQISLEEYQERVIAIESQDPDYEKKKANALAKLDLVNASRNLRKTKRATDGTFTMMMLAVENLDETIEIDDKSLEAAEPEEAHELAEEGILDSISNTVTGWREAYQNNKAMQAKSAEAQSKDIQDNATTLADIKKRFSKVTEKESSEVDVTKLSGKFLEVNHLRKTSNFPSNLIDAIVSNKKKFDSEFSKMDTAMSEMARCLDKLFKGLDYSSDVGLEKTYFKQLGDFRQLCLSSIYLPGTYIPLLGQGFIHTPDQNKEIFDLKDNTEWLKKYMYANALAEPSVGCGRDEGPQVKLTFTQDQVKTLINTTEQCIEQMKRIWPTNGRPPMYVTLDIVWSWYVKTYQLARKDIDFNGRKTNFAGLSDKNASLLTQTLPNIPAIAYADRKKYYQFNYLMIGRILHQLQLLNRILKGFGV